MIVVAGEALIDAEVEHDVLRPHAGGGPFNTAVALARLGAPACFLGSVSEDALGPLLERRLVDAGVDMSLVSHTRRPTPLALVEAGGSEARYSFYLEGSAYQYVGATTLPPDAAALHVGTLSLATDPPASALEALVERETDARVIVVDPNVRPAVVGDADAYRRRMARVLDHADVVKLSEADLRWLYGDRSADRAAAELLESGASCVVLTRGARGATGWLAGGGRVDVPAPAVDVVDTVGAGDAFGAGLLASLWQGGMLRKESLARVGTSELEVALRYAAAVGALQCTRAFAWAPSAHEVDVFLDRRSAAPSAIE
jgi:fructokinase